MQYIVDLQADDVEFSYFLAYLKNYKFELFNNWHFTTFNRSQDDEVYDVFKEYKERFEAVFKNPSLLEETIKQEEKNRQEFSDTYFDLRGQIGKEYYFGLLKKHELSYFKNCFELYREYYSLSPKKHLEFKLDLLGKELYLLGASEQLKPLYKYNNKIFMAYCLIRQNYFSLKNNQFPANFYPCENIYNRGTIHSHHCKGSILEEKNIDYVLCEYPKLDPRWKQTMYCTLKPSERTIDILKKYHYNKFPYLFESIENVGPASNDLLDRSNNVQYNHNYYGERKTVSLYTYLLSVQKQLFEIYNRYLRD